MDSNKIAIGSPSVGTEEAEAAYRVVASGRLAQGPEVAAAEAAFAEYTGAKHAVAVNNGTSALELALAVHGIGAGDEVITTPFSFFATAASIVRSGATPVFVDIEPDTYGLDPSLIEAAVTPRTAAIMPVHIFGRIVDMDQIGAVARKHGLAIIEDAAQAAGAWQNGRHAGTFGTGGFSFYGAKNITSGEGGMTTFDDDALAAKARRLRNHGSDVMYRHEEVSTNYRMTDLQAAVLRVQIQKLEKITIARQENGAFYDDAIRSDHVVLPIGNDDTNTSCYHQYTIRVAERRDELSSYLADKNIETRTFYPTPMHLQPAMKGAYAEGSLPVAEAACRQVLSLPVHPNLTREDLERVAEAVNAFA